MQLTSVGFTLLELLLVLAMGVILAALSYPTYIAYETHAKRNRAEVALTQLAGKMEIYFERHDSYAGATIARLHAKNLMDGLHYTLGIIRATHAHYEIAATPCDIQKKQDTLCGTLSLTDRNQRKISGSGTVAQCWL